MSIVDNIPDSEWEEIILRLQAFTRSLTRSKEWFRGKGTSTFLKGKEVEDYVYDAIGRFLKSPEKYDPSKGELVDYLKFHLVRSLVANDLRKAENKKSDDVFRYAEIVSDEEDSGSSYLDRVLPYIDAMFDENLDYLAITEFIEKEAQGDPVVENIYLGLYSYGMKRREIIEEFNFTAGEFNNGMRRLKTILSRASIHFDAKKQIV